MGLRDIANLPLDGGGDSRGASAAHAKRRRSSGSRGAAPNTRPRHSPPPPGDAPRSAAAGRGAAHSPPPPDDRVRAYVSALARRPQAVALRWLPGTEADATDPPGFKPLDAAMRAVLDALGATQLYRHQKEAIHAASRERRSVVVATPTASGKSLAYQVPLMATLGERRTSRAIVLFPLKALARDQLAKLRRFPEAAARSPTPGTSRARRSSASAASRA